MKKKFRLRTTLVVPFVLQIVTAVGLVGYISFRNGQQAVSDLANRLIEEKSDRISQHVLDYFSQPQAIVQMTHAALQSGNLNLDNLDGLRRYFWQVVEKEKLDNYLYLGTAEGEFIGVERRDDGTVEYKARTQASAPNREIYLLDEAGNPQELLKTGEYDPRQRPWYQEGIKDKSSWSPVFASASRKNSSLEISPLKTLKDADGQIEAVIAVNLRLVRITNYLQNLTISPHGESFIMERSGDLIASSASSEPFLIEGEGDDREIQRLAATNAHSIVVSQTAQFLERQFTDFDQISRDRQLQMNLDGERHYVQVMPFDDGRGIDWLTVVVVPEKDFMAQINRNTRNTVFLCSAALLSAIAIGIATARWVTHPILRVSDASDRLAKGDLNQQVDSSAIVEIDNLTNSFNSMAGQLENSFTTLEQKNQELRIAEENYRSIFENALEGIFQSSPQGYYLSVNPALATIYGYDSPQELVESITDISKQVYVDPEKRAEFRELMMTEGKAKDFEYRCYCKDGSIIWTQIDARVVKDNQGKVLYYEGIVQDITERKRREDELRKQLKELKIEIDHNKRAKEVAMLTNSNYFQEVQEEIAEVNLDEFWS